ncbi:hypothetical protein D3C73_884730 [compost metagenome]
MTILHNRATLFRHIDLFGASQVATSNTVFIFSYFFRGTRRHDITTGNTCTRTNVEQVVSVTDCILVMLNDKHRVTKIAQALKGADKTIVIALVKADRWLVKHVQDALQTRSNLCRKSDALSLAARKSIGRTRELKIIQSDIAHKAKTSRNLFHNLASNE